MDITGPMLSHQVRSILNRIKALENTPAWHRQRPRHEFNGRAGKRIQNFYDLATNNIIQWFHHIVKDSASFTPPMIDAYRRLLLEAGIQADDQTAKDLLIAKTAPLRFKKIPLKDLVPEFYFILTRQKDTPAPMAPFEPEIIRVLRPSDIRRASKGDLSDDEKQKMEARKIAVRKRTSRVIDRTPTDPDYLYMKLPEIQKLACDVHLLLKMLSAPECAGDDPSVLRNSIPFRQALAQTFKAQQIEGIPSTGHLLYSQRMRTRNFSDPMQPQ